uniref:Uncharacterized protein n=1 Tax=Oryza glumipatula TaxID=40148 RepID=A0A0E0AK16_9ORYZ
MARQPRHAHTRDGTGRCCATGTVPRHGAARPDRFRASVPRRRSPRPCAAALYHAAALPGCGSEQCRTAVLRDRRSRRMKARHRLGLAFPSCGGAAALLGHGGDGAAMLPLRRQSPLVTTFSPGVWQSAIMQSPSKISYAEV